MLDKPSLFGNSQVSEKFGGNGSTAECIFVDIHDFCVLQSQLALEIPDGHFSSMPGSHSINCRMNFYTGWNTEYRGALTDRLIDVPSRSVSAGEQDQVNPLVHHFARRPLCILGSGSPLGDRADDMG